MVTPFSCSQMSPWSRNLARLLPLPAWSWCPKPFSAHRLQCWNSHRLVWDCERRGLWLFPWPHPEALGLGSAGNQAGPSSQGQLHATRGCMGETSGDSGREGSVSGLLLGRAGPGGGSALWLQPLPFPCTQGHHTQPSALNHSTMPACGAALPWCWWELGGDAA